MQKASPMTLAILLCLASLLLVLRMADTPTHAAEKKGEPNRLIHETSPYLLQHAHNPVDWYPWGDAAFDKARKEDKPIFLSVGYSTCHWCHVMAHESFEDAGVAKIMNEHYVCIKVDREELPDVDEQYMLATQLFTRRGGWPNSVWLMPDGRPWYAGTYFPKEDRGGRPGFKTMLLSLAETWRDKRDVVEQQAEQFATAIKEASQSGVGQATQPVSMNAFTQAAMYFKQGYDERRGGFGGAPKFPPHGALRVLIHEMQQGDKPDPQTLSIVRHTLDAMARGGMYDHIGGGFHRYATDARWLLPHFEKMLYDNAQLIRAYTDGHRLIGDEDYPRVVAETFTWLQREMIDEAGGFYSAQDADSEGEEGKFYVWTHDEIVDILGDDDAALFTRVYNIEEGGNFEEEATGHRTGANIPHLTHAVEAIAKDTGVEPAALRDRLKAMRDKLLAVRVKRVYPHLDDKVLASWNGLMIGALAYAGKHLDNAAYTDAAAKAADFILANMRTDDGKLHRTWRDGKAKLPGYLDDYAYLAEGLLDLHRTTGDQRWADAARELADVMVADFYDEKHGGFFTTSSAHDDLLIRSKGLTGGGNTPNENGVAAQVLIDIAVLTQNKDYAVYAAGTLHGLSNFLWNNPHAAETLVVAVAQFIEKHDTFPAADEPGAPGDEATAKADASARVEPVTVELFAERLSVRPGETLRLAVRLAMDAGWHVYAADPGAENLLPTTIALEPIDGATLDALRWPAATAFTDPVLKEAINVYEGTQTVLAPVTIAADAEPGERVLSFAVRTQACDDKRCLAPVTHELSVTVTVSDTSGEPRHASVFERFKVK